MIIQLRNMDCWRLFKKFYY